MINWTDEELAEAGLDKAAVVSIVRRLRGISRDMARYGLSVYGASGSGCLVHMGTRPHHTSMEGKSDYEAVIAHVGNGFDGGDW